MNLRSITNLNKRQFDKTLQREGQDVTNFYNNDVYHVFFRTMKHSDSTVSKVRVYYSKDTKINKGTLFIYQGETYCVINKDAIESQVYNTSVACKCSTTLLCNGVYVPFVVSDLKNVYPVTGNVFSLISGAICIYSLDNGYTRSVEIGDSYSVFGGLYTIVNTFHNDGLAYIYLKRELASQEYSVTYDGAVQFNMSNGDTQQLAFVAKIGEAVESQANLTYSSSDESVATVDATGLMTMHKAGTVSITASWDEHSVSNTVEITITDSGSTPVDPESLCTATITHGGTNVIKIGGAYKVFTVTFTNPDGSAAAHQDGTWSFRIKRYNADIWENATSKIETAAATDGAENKIRVKIKAGLDDYMGGTFWAEYTSVFNVIGIDNSVEVQGS